MEVDKEPYLVFAKNRPHRIALIVDLSKRESADNIIKLVSDCSTKWGGRYFQIIPSVGASVSTKWIDYLSSFDPDIIYSYTQLSKQTIKSITKKCNPYAFMPVTRSMRISSHPDDPVDVLPDSINTSVLWRNPVSKPEILYFNTGEHSRTSPKYIDDFTQVNFGKLYGDLAYVRALEGSSFKVKILPAENRTQFLNSMQVLNEWNRRIYPIEYSMLPGVNYELNHEKANRVTTLFVGDSPLDLIFYWNDAIKTQHWLSTQKNQAWLATKFFKDDRLCESVKGWIDKFCLQRDDSSNVKELRIVSSSVNLHSLRRYAKKLLEGTYIHYTVEKISDPERLDYKGYGKYIATSPEMESFSVSGDNFTINLPDIHLRQGTMGGQKWMTDLYIQRKDHNEYRRPLKELWLQFPKDNNLALLVTGRQRSARINMEGLISIPMSRDRDELRLSAEIPVNKSIAENILLGERNSVHYTRDLRAGVEVRPFGHISNSVAGRSLRGAIHLFGGLAEASRFFESSYWRDVFMAFSGRDPLSDTRIAQDLKNLVRKNLNRVQKPITEKATSAWVNIVSKHASQLQSQSDVKQYRFFTEKLKDEIVKSKEEEDEDDKFEEVEKRLLQSLNWLIDCGIFDIGVMHRCTHCGLNSWYPLKNLTIHNKCVGCSYEFSVNAEQRWWYRLNSLISSNGGVYNQIPLILALGELYERSRTSFYYYPPIDVYMANSKSPLTDLDIFAIVDGELVIGEVKHSQELFNTDEILKIEKAALRIRPSRVVLTAMLEKPNAETQKLVKDLEQRLVNHGIDVEWLEMSPTHFMPGLWGI